MMRSVPTFLTDLDGKPSTMRLAATITVVGGVGILVAVAFGVAPGLGDIVSASDALLMIGAGLFGKVWQRNTEARQRSESDRN